MKAVGAAFQPFTAVAPQALKGGMCAHPAMATVIAALGGSLLRPEVEERHAWLESLIEIVRDSVAMDDRLGLVVGG